MTMDTAIKNIKARNPNTKVFLYVANNEFDDASTVGWRFDSPPTAINIRSVSAKPATLPQSWVVARRTVSSSSAVIGRDHHSARTSLASGVPTKFSYGSLASQ